MGLHMSEIVLVERQGAVMRLTINRPERRNALNEDVLLSTALRILGVYPRTGHGAFALNEIAT